VDSFSIRDLQRFSGIKAHTIRIWEQRYNALQPDRSEGNTRYYNSKQLKRLLNIVSLMNDHKISRLCTMPDKKLYELLDEQSSGTAQAEHTHEYFLAQMIAAALLYDELHFEKLFSNSILRLGIRNTYVNVIYPVLVRLGLWWAKDTVYPAQEHFITNLFRQKLFAAIDALPPATHTGDTWLLFLPEDEFHEIGLLFSNYLIRQSGKKVIYLGQNISLEYLKAAVDAAKPSNLLFFLVRKNNEGEDSAYISRLKELFLHQKIYIACDASRLGSVKTSKNIISLSAVANLEDVLYATV
jgi:DNA-binding transcriptional MerR regulator